MRNPSYILPLFAFGVTLILGSCTSSNQLTVYNDDAYFIAGQSNSFKDPDPKPIASSNAATPYPAVTNGRARFGNSYDGTTENFLEENVQRSNSIMMNNPVMYYNGGNALDPWNRNIYNPFSPRLSLGYSSAFGYGRSGLGMSFGFGNPFINPWGGAYCPSPYDPFNYSLGAYSPYAFYNPTGYYDPFLSASSWGCPSAFNRWNNGGGWWQSPSSAYWYNSGFNAGSNRFRQPNNNPGSRNRVSTPSNSNSNYRSGTRSGNSSGNYSMPQRAVEEREESPRYSSPSRSNSNNSSSTPTYKAPARSGGSWNSSGSQGGSTNPGGSGRVNQRRR